MNQKESIFHEKKQEFACQDHQNQETKMFEDLFRDFLKKQTGKRGDLSEHDLLIEFIEHFCIKNGIPFRALMDQLERSFLKRILSEMNGNQKATSKVLGIKPTTLYEKVKRHNIRFKKDSI